MADRPLYVLLVDDNDSDVEIARRTFAKSGVVCRLDVATDGDEALERLHRCKVGDPERDYSLPDLVLLDLRLPGASGIDVLRQMKADPTLARVPVVVVTASQAPEDSHTCAELGANLYLKKPMKIVDVVYMVLSVHKYWSAITDAAQRQAA